MHRGFSLTCDCEDFGDFYGRGKYLYLKHEKIIRKELQSFVNYDGSLNAKKMTENWFPQIKADVFISHSHKDEDSVILLAGWLYEKFGLTTFIDSCIWGYADELLKMIDDKYCWNAARGIYDYKKRNYSTSHVHMILTTALSNMIDNTECIFFLNTPNSITPESVIAGGPQTLSPWIYNEIAMTQLIRKKEPVRVMTEGRLQKYADKTLIVTYNVGLSHLTEIDMKSLLYWNLQYVVDNNQNPLDLFYELNTKKTI